MKTHVKRKQKCFKTKNFTFPIAKVPWTFRFLLFDKHRTGLDVSSPWYGQMSSLIDSFCQTGTENGGLNSETTSQLFLSRDLFQVILQRCLDVKYSFSWGVSEVHMPEVSDMMVTCRVTDLECDACQHVLLTQGGDVTAASHGWSSFRMKWIFISDDDWKGVHINSVGRKNYFEKKTDVFGKVLWNLSNAFKKSKMINRNNLSDRCIFTSSKYTDRLCCSLLQLWWKQLLFYETSWGP